MVNTRVLPVPALAWAIMSFPKEREQEVREIEEEVAREGEIRSMIRIQSR